MKLFMAFALLILGAAFPAVAEGHNRMTASSHMRPQLFHDRTPHVHDRGVQQHHGA